MRVSITRSLKFKQFPHGNRTQLIKKYLSNFAEYYAIGPVHLAMFNLWCYACCLLFLIIVIIGLSYNLISVHQAIFAQNAGL